MHGFQVSEKEVVGAGNEEQLGGFGSRGGHLAELVSGGELVAVAAEQQLGHGALGEEAVMVISAFSMGGQAEGCEGADARVRATGGEAHGCAKGEAGGEDGPVVAGDEPVERAADVVGLVAAVVVALAESGSAKVEAENGPAEGGKDFGGVVDHLVVHGAAALGVGMAKEGGKGGIGLTFVEQGFEASGWSGEKEAVNGAGGGGKGCGEAGGDGFRGNGWSRAPLLSRLCGHSCHHDFHSKRVVWDILTSSCLSTRISRTPTSTPSN